MKSGATYRRCACLLVLALVLSCGDKVTPKAIALPEEEKKPEFTLRLEEDGAPRFVELNRSTILMMTEVYSMVRFIPWRLVTATTSEGGVRMSLGYGAGFSKEMTAQINKEMKDMKDNPLFGMMFGAVERWDERQFFQLNATQLAQMLELLDRLEKVELSKPPSHVNWRAVELTWGDVKFRKADDGYWVFIPGEDGGWEPLPLPKFRAAVKQAQSDLKTLMDAAPSAKL